MGRPRGRPKKISNLESVDIVTSKQSVNIGINALKIAQNAILTYVKSHSESIKPVELSKLIKNVTDSVDKTIRYVEFAQGNPDSRPGSGLDELFAKLPLEQVRQIKQWLDEARLSGQSKSDFAETTPTTSSSTRVLH